MMRAKRDWIKPKKKVVVSNAWVLRDSQRSTIRFRILKLILKYAKLYCQYSSLTGFKYLADSRRTWFERILWVLIYCITISSLIFIVYNSYEDFITTPTVTSMDTDHYPTTELNFPGIAICSVNRISRESATKLANKISHSNATDLTFDKILSLINQLGNLYASEFEMDMKANMEIHQLLRAYHKGDYDIGNIMEELSPRCSIMLVVCKLHGNIENCSQIFTMRKTQDGYCCTFNYVRESDDIPVITDAMLEPIEAKKVVDLGIERGLTIVMEPSLDDYFYTILPVKGWKIIVFDPHDFPDVSSGGVTEVLAEPRTETYIDVSGVSFFSAPYIKRFPVTKRKCIFSEERRTRYGATRYTYSDCIVDCKAHEMQNICGCRPFFYPRRGIKECSRESYYTTESSDKALFLGTDLIGTDESHFRAGTSFDVNRTGSNGALVNSWLYERQFSFVFLCTLPVSIGTDDSAILPAIFPSRGKSDPLKVCTSSDLKCLTKYKSKWWTILPHNISDKYTRKHNWSLICQDCYPACEDVKYEVLSSKSYMEPGQYETDLLRNFTIKDQGIVHVYFSQYGSIRLKQDVAYRWYELMSDIGAICGIFIGFSFISLVEFMYFVTLAIHDLLCKQPVVENDSDENEIPNETIWTIHWNELMPRSWQSINYRHPEYPDYKGKY